MRGRWWMGWMLLVLCGELKKIKIKSGSGFDIGFWERRREK